MPTNNNINYGPQPLPGTTPQPVLGNNIDRGPAAVPQGPATGVYPPVVKPVVPVTEQPVVVPPIPVQTPILPVIEQAVDLTANADVVAGPNVSATNQQRYITILENGTVVVTNASSLNFTGNVTVTASGTYGANIAVSGGGGGNGSPGGSNNQIQYNNNGSFAGSSGLTWDNGNAILSVTGNVFASSSGSFKGNTNTGVNALYGGREGFTALGSNVIAQFTASVNSYAQVNFQNINNGGRSSTDYILTADNGTDSTHYVDLGMAGSNHSDPAFFGDSASAGDGYLYVTATSQAGPSNGAGNLILGSTNGVIKMFVGNTAQANVVATLASNTINLGFGNNTWTFDNSGTLTFPDNSGSDWPINQQRFGMGNIGAWLDGQWTIGEFSGNGVSGQVGIRIDPGIEGNTGITIPSQADSTTQRVSIYNTGGGGIELYTGANNWEFNADGTTLFPNSTINPGNGISLTTRTQSSGNDYAIAYQSSSSWEAYAEDDATGAHAAYAWIKADLNTVETPRVFITNAKGSDGTELTWTFDADGNLTIPGSILGSGNLYIAPDANNLGGRLDIFLTYGPDIHIAGVGENLILGRDDGANVTVGANGTVTIQADTGTPQLWNFGYTGNLTVPGNIVTTDHGFQFTSDISNVTVSGGNVYVETVDNVFGGPSTGQVVISGVTGTTQANGTWWYTAVDNNAFQLYTSATIATPVNGTGWSTYASGGTAVAGVPADISITANGNSWTFGANGSTIFPTLTVDLHNGGNQSGQTLQFGDPSQQAFITGPTPPTGESAQRLIIQGQNGGTGEGGDVYVWGGDSQYNGGDIKIYAGDADNGSSGQGGNIHISGGTGQNPGGEISVTGGTTYNGSGAPVVVTGGRGSTTGGNIDLRGGYGDVAGGPISIVAGYGASTGGNVDITGGISGNGLGYYGNVNINAGASSWHFDNAGMLTVPGEGVINSVNDTVTLRSFNTSTGNANSVYLGTSGGLGFNDTDIGGNWLEIFRNGTEPEIRVPVGLGNLYIQTASGNTPYNWTFGDTGKLTMPGPAQLAVYANVTVRDSSITSPTPGMMIYVTGTGMQVRGATSWNTIAGSGT